MRYKRIFVIVLNITILSVLFFFIRSGSDHLISKSISPYLALGFLVLVAHLGGIIAQLLNLPALTGNLAIDILFGPDFLHLITATDIGALELINSLALSFIAITAGGELKLKNLRQQYLTILLITISHTVIIFVVIYIFFFVLFTHSQLLPISDPVIIKLICIFLGVVAVANSPASTIAVINECRSKGSFTDVVLGVTMIKDVVVLVLFTIACAGADSVLTDQTVSFSFLVQLFGHIFLSAGAGLVFGSLMILFFKYIGQETTLFVVLASYVAHDLAHFVGLEHMLMCLIAGFVVQNFSRQGHRMIVGIEHSHLPIYVIFFALAGASLDFSYFRNFYQAVIIFIVVRSVLVFLTTYLGAYLAKAPATIRNSSWTGFITNAGLTLSIVIIIEDSFPDWGALLKAFVISIIAINQIIGPILFKFGLDKSGEATRIMSC